MPEMLQGERLAPFVRRTIFILPKVGNLFLTSSCIWWRRNEREKKWMKEKVSQRREQGQSWSWSTWHCDSWYCQLGETTPLPLPLTFPPDSTVPAKLITRTSDLQQRTAPALANVTSCLLSWNNAGDVSRPWHGTRVRAKHFLYLTHSDRELKEELIFILWYLIESNPCSQFFFPTCPSFEWVQK